MSADDNHMSESPPKLQKYVVLYIDFLGTKDAMLKDENRMLQTFYELYHSAISVVSQLEAANYTEMKARIFSDNLVIAFRKHIREFDDEITLFDIVDALNFSVFFQTEAMKRGLLIRGGITIGNMYFDDVFIYGEALVRAYDLENHKARFPRIIVDNCVNRFIKNNKSYFDMFPKELFCISADEDTECFVDYLSVAGMDAYDRAEIIKSGREIVKRTERLPEYTGDIRLQEKMNWQTRYFSYIEEKYREGAENGSEETDRGGPPPGGHQ
ncbi:hypothetical protein AALD01_12890 [Oscillospiraceae bacterium 21-37]|nr:hypothetical protein [uncultured Oscillibacter sp.]